MKRNLFVCRTISLAILAISIGSCTKDKMPDPDAGCQSCRTLPTPPVNTVPVTIHVDAGKWKSEGEGSFIFDFGTEIPLSAYPAEDFYLENATLNDGYQAIFIRNYRPVAIAGGWLTLAGHILYFKSENAAAPPAPLTLTMLYIRL